MSLHLWDMPILWPPQLTCTQYHTSYRCKFVHLYVVHKNSTSLVQNPIYSCAWCLFTMLNTTPFVTGIRPKASSISLVSMVSTVQKDGRAESLWDNYWRHGSEFSLEPCMFRLFGYTHYYSGLRELSNIRMHGKCHEWKSFVIQSICRFYNGFNWSLMRCH